MQAPASTKKRLLLMLLPLLMLAAVIALLVSMDQARTYKKLTIGDTALYVPKTFINEEKADLVNMIRDTIGAIELEKYQFGAYADEVLPEELVFDENIANSSLIWTVGRAPENMRDGLTEPDWALLTGKGAYADRTANKDSATGLVKLERTSEGGRTFAYTNTDPATASDTSRIWVAHCIELGSIRPGGPSARCTAQLAMRDLLVQIHFDGRLIANTATVTNAVRHTLDQWREEPEG